MTNLKKETEGFIDKIKSFIPGKSQKLPEWTLRDGNDLKLRELKSGIMELLIEGLVDYGVIVDNMVATGYGKEKKLMGIIRGHLNPYSGGQIEIDEEKPISIESINPLIDDRKNPCRERIVYPPEFNIPPFAIIVRDGKEHMEKFDDLELDLKSTMEALNFYDFIQLSFEQAKNILSVS